MTFDSFVSGLENYDSDKKELDRLKEHKKDLEYLEAGVKGVNPGKESFGGGNPSVAAQMRLNQIDKIEDVEKEIELLQANLNFIIKQYEKQDEEIKKILELIYFKKTKKIDASIKLGFKNSVELDRYLKRSYIY